MADEEKEEKKEEGEVTAVKPDDNPKEVDKLVDDNAFNSSDIDLTMDTGDHDIAKLDSVDTSGRLSVGRKSLTTSSHIEGLSSHDNFKKRHSKQMTLGQIISKQLVIHKQRTIYTQTDWKWKKMALRWRHAKIMHASFLEESDFYLPDPERVEAGNMMLLEIAETMPELYKTLTAEELQDLSDVLSYIGLKRTDAQTNLALQQILASIPHVSVSPALMKRLTVSSVGASRLNSRRESAVPEVKEDGKTSRLEALPILIEKPEISLQDVQAPASRSARRMSVTIRESTKLYDQFNGSPKPQDRLELLSILAKEKRKSISDQSDESRRLSKGIIRESTGHVETVEPSQVELVDSLDNLIQGALLTGDVLDVMAGKRDSSFIWSGKHNKGTDTDDLDFDPYYQGF